MTELLVAKESEEAKVGTWAQSAMHGKSKDAEICCNADGTACKPFPECCDCPSSSTLRKKVLGREH